MTLSSSSSTVIVTKGRKLKSWKIEKLKQLKTRVTTFGHLCVPVCVVASKATKGNQHLTISSSSSSSSNRCTAVSQHSWSLRWQLHFTSLHFTHRLSIEKVVQVFSTFTLLFVCLWACDRAVQCVTGARVLDCAHWATVAAAVVQ